MKTLRIILLISGIIGFQSAFSFSLLNLPGEPVYVNPVDNLAVITSVRPEVLNKAKNIMPDKTTGFDDTIVIDLAEVVIESAFPASSVSCISQQVPYPKFAVKHQLEGIVATRFVFDGYGRVHVRETSSNSPLLESYVVHRLKNLRLKNCVVDVDRDYYLRFVFKLY